MGRDKLRRFPPRWQLEQWQQCRRVRVESEQYADQHEHQHWVSGRQEPRLHILVPGMTFRKRGWLECRSRLRPATVSIEDLPFVSVPTVQLVEYVQAIAGRGIIPTLAIAAAMLWTT